jgi:competence protein ComEA
MLKKFLAILVMCFAAVAMAAVDVNKATEAQLDSVKGIGPVTSKLIMSERKKGEFKSWQDFIDRVKGIGDDRAAKLSAEGLTVNGTAYKAAAATKKDEKAAAKDEKKEAKAAAKDEKKEAKAVAKEEKKEAKAAAKDEKKDAKVATKEEKKEAKAEAAKPAASAKK